MKPAQAPAAAPRIQGLEARLAVHAVLERVLVRGRTLDDALAEALAPSGSAAAGDGAALDPRDRAFVRLLATTVVRRAGTLEALVAACLERPLPDKQRPVLLVLLSGAAQLLMLATPPHAAIGLAVDVVRRVPGAARFDKLVNAVLRRLAATGTAHLATLTSSALDIPDWLSKRWTAAYGAPLARRIAEASLAEAPLDLSVKVRADAGMWAERLGGIVLPTGTIRLASGSGRIEELPGFAEGAWWVQDAAAALPARLFGDVGGMRIADLCAAPGGKSAELAAAGARVTAIDISELRLARVRENLTRLGLDAELVAADATAPCLGLVSPAPMFDAVLLDAPCSATGTIRRHPDILRLKRPGDLAALAAIQARLLDAAVALVKPGGLLVYCTCSLEPEEGETQVARLLSRHPGIARVPVQPAELGLVGVDEGFVTVDGDLRTLPCHGLGASSLHQGLDGFYAARLRVTDLEPQASEAV